jgi:hypothetical protein
LPYTPSANGISDNLTALRVRDRNRRPQAQSSPAIERRLSADIVEKLGWSIVHKTGIVGCLILMAFMIPF